MRRRSFLRKVAGAACAAVVAPYAETLEMPRVVSGVGPHHTYDWSRVTSSCPPPLTEAMLNEAIEAIWSAPPLSYVQPLTKAEKEWWERMEEQS